MVEGKRVLFFVVAGFLYFGMVPVAHSAEILFGSEFTFSNQEMLLDPGTYYDPNRDTMIARESDTVKKHMTQLMMHMTQHLVEGQPMGAKFDVINEGFNLKKFISPTGWWVRVEKDRGVIETNLKPMTLEDWERFAGDIQDALFVSAHNNGLFPMDYLGGGHISISLYAFEDEKHFRNFLVDYLNHAELALGVMNYDTNNALSYLQTTSSFQKNVQLWIKDVDAGKYQGDLFEAARAFARLQNDGSIDEYFLAWGHALSRTKEFSFNLKSLVNLDPPSHRLEIRAVRPQKTVEMFVRQIRLFKKRIDYLKQVKHPIAFQPRLQIKRLSIEDSKLIPPVDTQQALSSFYHYVIESGESWRDHQDYLWPRWIQDGEVDRFNQALEKEKKVSHSPQVLGCGLNLVSAEI